ncbi:MAG: pyruvate ferredoxin oxidoreductase [Thermoproteota archaeon]|nr:MAG: pyruvate ferredoxin oxidoreductase [Candidatus Korarchaeota archaeon]
MAKEFVPNIRQLPKFMKEDPGILPGHRACAGCGCAIILRQLMMARRKPLVIANATGCMEVVTTIFPYTAWKTPWIHVAFENAAAVAAGIDAGRNKLQRSGRFSDDPDVSVDYDVVALAGDGGTYDIGLQALSGALERWHNFLYILYDNEAYMNTGIQRSGGTPFGAWTTTTPVGSKIKGKPLTKKPIVDIVVAHRIPYAATVSPAYWVDALKKFRKGLETEGPAFIHAFGVCPRGWRTDTKDTIKLSRLAVETCFFPLYEVVNSEWYLTGPSLTIAKNPERKKPVEEYLKLQGRFRHMLLPENKWMLEKFQELVDENWEIILKRAKNV